MVDADVFGTTRVELVNGRVYRMTQKQAHIWAVSKIVRLLTTIVPREEWLITQGTLRLDDRSMPDPDFVWLPCAMGTPAEQWPTPVLLIEVSDTTYRKDSGVKLRTYAAHRIPEYWIVNLAARRVEVYRDPVSPGGQRRGSQYQTVSHHGPGATVTLSTRPDVSVLVDDLLP